MHTPNKADDNFKKLAALFPNAVTETIDENGEVVRAIDKDVLMQEISCTVVDGNEERYQFTWPDKKKSVLLANAPIAKTLRPCREESVGKDGTPGGFDSENLYIEGDNLEVLKLLQETYLGKIKMIYIDPPYNTGNDFVYEDDFAQNTEEYLANSGQFDEDGNRLVPNTESNGRFHTDWLNMIYPRLRLAKDLLTDDGVIFISIDENEIENLKKVCDDTFGEKNFVASVIWERAFAPKNDAKYFSDSHDYIVIYAKNLIDFQIGKLPRTEEANSRYKNPDNDPRGPWASDNMTVKTYSANYDYKITTPNGTIMKPADGRCWFTSKERMNKLIEDGRVWFGEDGGNMPRLKRYLADVQQGMTPTTIWKHEDVGHNQEGRQELKKLFDDKGYFDGPKPVRLIERALLIGNLNSDSLILDFFSGSATTAHAVMKYNAEKGTNCKFIMVQVPEETDKKSEAYKSGYKTICEIGKERIRRAGAKIREENEKKKNMILLENEKDAQLFFDIAKHGKDAVERTKSAFKQVDGSYLIDTGFRVLKCDTSNMKDVYYNPADYEADLFDMMTDNIKEDRTPEDLLFQIMLDLGIELSSKIEETVVAGKKVFDVADGFLIACFDANVTDETIKAIAQKQPYYFVMRDSSLANDCVATNFEQIFATYSPDTVRKVL
ncbi:site-specific DNA-methyltransferase [Butyricicoccus pullicaecorum]|uniref:Site-specific DNA-methyltransferase n=2 Tax=Butyricicoccus pullicaecorum TaxID=501571 RepID=A0A1Y4LQ50_9FIRM|nr:site-specific DNA-methyltransferase [Butyricicoccus pullicaecorum]